MTEPEALLTIFEKTIENSNAITQALERTAQRQDENALALARTIGEHSQLLAKGIEDNSQALARILERITQTTDRTERMTAEILSRLVSAQSTSH